MASSSDARKAVAASRIRHAESVSAVDGDWPAPCATASRNCWASKAAAARLNPKRRRFMAPLSNFRMSCGNLG